MINMFIALFIAIISVNLFNFSYQINGVNRLVMAMPISLFESAIVLFDLSHDEMPYFNQTILKENVYSYFDYSLPRYCSQYSINISYYNKTDHSLYLYNRPEAVTISIHATLDFAYSYQKAMNYEIR